MMAFIPEAQTLFIVVHGVEIGKPKTNISHILKKKKKKRYSSKTTVELN